MNSLSIDACENLVSDFRACELCPFNPEQVYSKLPSDSVMSPSKAVDQSLLEMLHEMRNGDADNTTPTNTKSNRLDVEPGKSLAVECNQSEPEIYDTDSDSSSYSSDMDGDEEPATTSPPINDIDEELKMDEIEVSQWVKVVYEGEYFLGKVLVTASKQSMHGAMFAKAIWS